MSGLRRIAAAAVVASLLGPAGCATDGGVVRLPETAVVAQRLVLVSVTGLTARSLVSMPTLAAMAEAGAVALRVEGTAPASTRPAHATLVTGAPPAAHGIVAERRLGERGVRRAGYDHASLLRVDTLWQRAQESGLRVASIDWPSTLGAAIPELVPDLGDAVPSDRSWVAQLGGEATPEAVARLSRHGGDAVDAGTRGPARDPVITGVACELASGGEPPRVWMLRLSGAAPAFARHGPGSPEVERAFAQVDGEIRRLLACFERAGRLPGTAFVVTGDHGFAAVHTAVAPNTILVEEGLVRSEPGGGLGWRALVRSNGGSAFVYARDEAAALRARVALAAGADRSGAYRVVSADEMIRSGADPEAWFGLEAAPGFAFRDGAAGPLLVPSEVRGVGGYLAQRDAMDVAFVAWGAGVRRGLRVPEMRQSDVAPTLARLLRLDLPGAGGRALVGVLTPETQRGVASEPR